MERMMPEFMQKKTDNRLSSVARDSLSRSVFLFCFI